ncbi:MAG: NAD(P)H-quinone oxidoreductase [Gammaproteobacteria bacterium]
MQCITISSPGTADVLALSEAEQPVPGAGEVLIRVLAAGVNRPDVFQRMGLYDPPPDASPLPGLEVAGVVEAIADDVKTWSVGDSVCALTNGGGYAEYAVAPAAQCLPVPTGLSFVQAAALPETCFTVWTNVFDRARLQPGESLLVHGGSSGIGTTAIQMAHALGSTVYATAGSEAKCLACTGLGATLAVNYKERDFVAEIKSSEDSGVDVILDMVGGDYVQRNMSLAAMDGRIVNIAFLQGSKVELNLMPVMLKRLTLSGSTLRPQSATSKASIAAALRSKVWPLIADGKIKPLIDSTYQLADAADAHRQMESNQHIGKIILDLSEGASS